MAGAPLPAPAAAPLAAALDLDGAAPLLLPYFCAHWPALELWRGAEGRRHLAAAAGGVRVRVMVAAAGGAGGAADFSGDAAGALATLEAPLADYLDGALAARLAAGSATGAHPPALYLAQAALAERGAGARPPPAPPPRTPLGAALLGECAPLPPALAAAPLTSANLWASATPTRSSCHYDPYGNALCVVTGAKRVRLAPPCAAAALRARPAWHESANHAAGSLWPPDAAGAGAAVAEARLGPGDGLFIPEGWWHQVESDAGTLAVNFWSEAPAAAAMYRGAAAPYRLRRLAQAAAEDARRAAVAAMVAAAAPPPRDADGAALLAAALDAAPAGGREERPGDPVTAALLSLAAAGPLRLVRALEALAARPLSAPRLLARLGPPAWELLTSWLEEALQDYDVPSDGETALEAMFDVLYAPVPDRRALAAVACAAKAAFGARAMAAALAAAIGPGVRIVESEGGDD
jgi:hypothetical protein